MQTYFPVLGVLGMMLMLFGLVMGFPLAVSFALDDGATAAYDLAILATFASGLLMWAGTRGAHARGDGSRHTPKRCVRGQFVLLDRLGRAGLIDSSGGDLSPKN